MNNKLTKSARMIALALGLTAGPAVPSYAYVMNTFDSLTNLTAGPNTSIAIDNVNYIEGTGSVKMSWDANVNSRGYFDWTLPGVTNFTGESTSFAAYTPSYITDVSIEWYDSSGRLVEGWYWTPSLSNQWNPFTAIQGNASGATGHIIGSGDITQIASIRFDEISVLKDGTVSYNNWDPVPEPNTILLLGSGLALLAGARKKMLA
jgi:hypothetical protein